MARNRILAAAVTLVLLAAWPVSLLAQSQKLTLGGAVVSEDGQPVKGASIQACSLRKGVGSICQDARTDGSGKFSVEVSRSDDGSILVQARKKGFNWTELRIQNSDIPTSDLRLVLGRGGNLNVIVDGVDQAQWGQLAVKVIARSKELRPATALPWKNLDIFAYQRSGAKSIDEYLERIPPSASFTIRDIPVGDARVEITRPSGESLPAQTVKIKLGAQSEVRFRVPKSGLQVSGRVTVDGKPIAVAMISFSRPGETTATGVPTAADGAFAIEGLAPGEYVVRVMTQGAAEVGGTSVVVYHEVGFVNWTLTESTTRDIEITRMNKPEK